MEVLPPCLLGRLPDACVCAGCLLLPPPLPPAAALQEFLNNAFKPFQGGNK
jgi:hypothetical protein